MQMLLEQLLLSLYDGAQRFTESLFDFKMPHVAVNGICDALPLPANYYWRQCDCQ